MVGTPEYASPEQAELTTGDVDESSDVYSLGVLLYELLIGTVPYDSAGMRTAGLAEMLRIIREEEVPPLPRKLTAMGAAAAEIAALRQTDPVSLRHLMDGDLNRIVLKALEKVRDRRYPSATEFAADIQRYTEHRPVLATRAGGLYRARKFIRRHRPAVFGTAGGLALILLCSVTVWSLVRRESSSRPRLKDKGVIVLADFANGAGDPGFDGTLRQVLAGELRNSPYVAVLSDARMNETLRLMARPPGTKFTPDVASEICERTASGAVVEGSVARLGSEYVLGLRARNCRTGDVLDQEQASAAKKEEVFKKLGQIATRFATRGAESVPAATNEASESTAVTTPSLEAWRSFSAATKATQGKAQTAETLSLLKRAIELDPKFAMAYAYLGRIQDGLGESETASRNMAKAYELRDRVSDRENYFISFNYHRQVTRNLELARQSLVSWAQKYPDDIDAHGLMSGFTSMGVGRYAKAVEEGQKAIELAPNFSIAYANVAWAYVYQNRLPEAEAVLRKAAERRIDTVYFSLCRYVIAFLRSDEAALEREVTRRQANLEAQGWFDHQQALTLAYRGRLKEADRVSERAVNLTRQGGLLERAALFEGAHAVWDALLGNRAESNRYATTALALYRSRDADYGPAFALSLLHESAQARKISKELEKRYPEDTSVQFSYLPTLRALEALNEGDLAKALEVSQAATPYDLGVPGTAFYTGAFFGALYAVYVRGVAYSRMGRYREAAAEFQKIVDHEVSCSMIR